MTWHLALTGISQVSGQPRMLYEPSLNNVLEQKLYGRVLKTTGVTGFDVSLLPLSSGTCSSSKVTLSALELALQQALKDAHLPRKFNRKTSSRVGLLYFDQYGPLAFMDHNTPIRDSHYIDTFPTFLLENHNITGTCIKLRGETNLMMEALSLASILIEGGELDTVLLGGVTRCHSYLFLSETLDNHAWSRGQKRVKQCSETIEHLVERCMFAVVQGLSSRPRNDKAIRAYLGDPIPYSFTDTKSMIDQWHLQWQSLADEKKSIQRCYGGSIREKHTNTLEQVFMREHFPEADIVQLAQQYGDSAALNNLLPFCHPSTTGFNTVELIHSYDRNGFGWNLLVENCQFNREKAVR